MVYSNSGPRKKIIIAVFILIICSVTYVYYGEAIKSFLREQNLLSQLLTAQTQKTTKLQDTLNEKYGATIDFLKTTDVFLENKNLYELPSQNKFIDVQGFLELISFLVGDLSTVEQELGASITVESLKESIKSSLDAAQTTASESGQGSQSVNLQNILLEIIAPLPVPQANVSATASTLTSLINSLIHEKANLHPTPEYIIDLEAIRKILHDQGITAGKEEIKQIVSDVYAEVDASFSNAQQQLQNQSFSSDVEKALLEIKNDPDSASQRHKALNQALNRLAEEL